MPIRKGMEDGKLTILTFALTGPRPIAVDQTNLQITPHAIKPPHMIENPEMLNSSCRNFTLVIFRLAEENARHEPAGKYARLIVTPFDFFLKCFVNHLPAKFQFHIGFLTFAESRQSHAP